MGPDDVAILRARHRADYRSALARAGGTPLDREGELGARRRMRGNAYVVNPIGTSHHGPLNGDGPPKQTGLVIKYANGYCAAAERLNISYSRPNTTADSNPERRENALAVRPSPWEGARRGR